MRTCLHWMARLEAHSITSWNPPSRHPRKMKITKLVVAGFNWLTTMQGSFRLGAQSFGASCSKPSLTTPVCAMSHVLTVPDAINGLAISSRGGFVVIQHHTHTGPAEWRPMPPDCGTGREGCGSLVRSGLVPDPLEKTRSASPPLAIFHVRQHGACKPNTPPLIEHPCQIQTRKKTAAAALVALAAHATDLRVRAKLPAPALSSPRAFRNS